MQINISLLVGWAETFLRQIPDDGQPSILFLDGHVTHTYNLAFLEMMKARHFEVICFPAHTTHLLQAADKSFFRSLKSHWNESSKNFLRKSGGAHVSKSNFFDVFTPRGLQQRRPRQPWQVSELRGPGRFHQS